MVTTGLFLLRISPVRFLVPLIIGIEVATLFATDSGWRTEWRWAADWSGAGTILVGPVLAGVAAWRAQSVRRTRGELIAAARAGGRSYAGELIGIGGWAVISHVLVVVVAVGACYAAGLRGVPPLWPVLLQLLNLGFSIGIGYVLGQFSESRLLPPVTSIALLFAVAKSASGPVPPLWFEVAGATAPLAGLDYRPAVWVAQAVAAAALLLLPLSALRFPAAHSYRLVVGVVAVACVVPSLMLLATTEQSRFTLSRSTAALACRGTDPVVCLRSENMLGIADIHAVLQALTQAAGPGAGAPTRFVQVTNADTRAVDGRSLMINSSTVSAKGVRPDLIAHYFVWNRVCLQRHTPPPVDAQVAGEQLSELLQVRAGLLDPASLNDTAVTRFLRAPEAEQQAWIDQLMKASDRCAFDAFPKPL